MYPDKHLLGISLTTKLSLCLVHIRLVAFFPLTKYSCLRHFFLIATSYLHVTCHMICQMTKSNFIYLH